MKITSIPCEDVRKVWPKVKDLLRPAVQLSSGRYTMTSLWASLRAGQYALWIVYEENTQDTIAALVTMTQVYPARTMTCVLFAGGGNMQEWLSLANETLLRYAKDVGTDGLEIIGRKGWLRCGKPLGWQETATIIDRGLE